jgi:hypothetical protein
MLYSSLAVVLEFHILGIYHYHKTINSQVLVTHACNPSYSGGRNQKDCGSKPVQANSSQDPISKKPFTKKGLVEWKVQALSSSPSSAK